MKVNLQLIYKIDLFKITLFTKSAAVLRTHALRFWVGHHWSGNYFSRAFEALKILGPTLLMKSEFGLFVYLS